MSVFYLGLKRIFCLWQVLVLLLVFQLPIAVSAKTNPIKHVIVIIQENHTFDNYFGTFPGANGISSSMALPTFPNSSEYASPYHLPSAVPALDLCHERECAAKAFNNGKMDGFVYAEESPLTLGYFDYREIPYYWDYASEFVLADNYFTSVLGPSLPNHLYLLAGQSGGIVDNAENITLDFPCIMDELDKAGISWRYYGVGDVFYTANPLPAFISFKNNQSRFANCQPTEQFYSDISNRKLAEVVWIRNGSFSEHPPQNVTVGQNFVVSLVNSVMNSPYWSSTVILITWDDYGGWYDHVAPPQADEAGYGFRVPLLIISPYAKKGFVDHVLSDHTSILKFIETTFSLSPLTTRDAQANSLLEAFDFNQTPREPLVLPGAFVPDHYPLLLSENDNPYLTQHLQWVLVVIAATFSISLFTALWTKKHKHVKLQSGLNWCN